MAVKLHWAPPAATLIFIKVAPTGHPGKATAVRPATGVAIRVASYRANWSVDPTVAWQRLNGARRRPRCEKRNGAQIVVRAVDAASDPRVAKSAACSEPVTWLRIKTVKSSV
jgi:hypothetical protein